jgi:hypothetical protein
MQYLLSLPNRHSRLYLPQALRDKQRPVDKHAVGGPVDLKVAEEDIRAEEGQDFVDAVVRLAVWLYVDVRAGG